MAIVAIDPADWQNANTVQIEGLNGTLVNGKVMDNVSTTASIFPWVTIDLGNGGDVANYIFAGEQFAHLTEVITGNGDDQVTICANSLVGPTLIGPTNVDTGAGNDTTTLRLGADVYLEFSYVTTGVGQDSVHNQSFRSRTRYWIASET